MLYEYYLIYLRQQFYFILGNSPTSLKGSKTGVFVGTCFSESENTCLYEKLEMNGFGLTGCSLAMLANRISYWLGVNGKIFKKYFYYSND